MRLYFPGLRLSTLRKHTRARTQKHQKELGQYPDILTSCLVRNTYMWNEYHAFLPCCEISELSGKFPRVARSYCCRFSPSVIFLMHKAAFARDHSYLAPKGLTIAPQKDEDASILWML